MKHKEWLGKKELVKRLLKKSGLYIVDKRNTIKLTMRCIIWFRYIDLMSVEETITKLWLDYGIELSYSKYYRLLNRALDMIEKRKKSRR